MSNYEKDWTDAKTKFEKDTDAKKPVQTGKILFISYRKSTGIESALEAIDKLCPGTAKLEGQSSEVLAKAEPLLAELKKKVGAYKGELDKAIKAEKPDKANSGTYRALKVLLASLDEIVAAVENDFGRGQAGVKATRELYQGAAGAVLKILQPIRSGIDMNCKKGISVAQKLLSEPTPANFNAAFPGAARDITQQVGNLYKYSFPDELTGQSKETVEKHLNGEPRLLLNCLRLKSAAQSSKTFLQDFTQMKGSTCLDSNLWRMANNPPKLSDDADAATVKSAIKNYLLQVKEAQKLVGILQAAGV
jgi:hypothetical protein